MSVLVVGLSHHSAPLAVLERAALPAEAAAKLTVDLRAAPHLAAAMVLATCNRTEVYAEVSRFHGGLQEATELLARAAALPVETLSPHLYVHFDDRAVQHLFTVAAGLDSMVVGESEILGQLRAAYRTAREEDAVGRALGALVQQALRVGKRVRAETGISRAGASVVGAGLDLAEQVAGPLRQRRALVVGAGSMGALAAAQLQRRGVAELAVLNRTPERAERIATAYAARAADPAGLSAELARADLVVSCTGATGIVVPAEAVAAGLAGRAGRPLVVLDLALPHDVEPSVAELPGVTLVDLAGLGTAVRAAAADEQVGAARSIVTEEVAGYLAWRRTNEVAPTVVALRAQAAGVVAAELDRLDGRLPGLDPRARAELATTVRRVVDKLLHAPTVRVKELAEHPDGRAYAEALRELFGLDPAGPESLARADVVAELAGDERGWS